MFIEKILRWLTPYKYLDDPIESAPEGKKRNKLSAKEHLERGLLGVEVITINGEMGSEEAKERLLTAEADRAYYVHTGKRHQLAVKFLPRSSKRYQYRSNKHRRELKPVIYPNVKVFDRTHIVPIGYHGSESDNRLLVGFDSTINRKHLNNFEAQVAKINNRKTILWFVDIEKKPDESAVWKAYVWDESGNLLKSGKWHDKSKFLWL